MRSVFSSFVTMHRKFDLKGSTVDRQASDKEKVVNIYITGVHADILCMYM